MRNFIALPILGKLLDHRQNGPWSLKWLKEMSNSYENLAHCQLHLSEIKSDIFHRTDAYHQAADTLSQLSVKSNHDTPLNDNVPVLVLTSEKLAW